jgi:hypothetical protein
MRQPAPRGASAGWCPGYTLRTPGGGSLPALIESARDPSGEEFELDRDWLGLARLKVLLSGCAGFALADQVALAPS